MREGGAPLAAARGYGGGGGGGIYTLGVHERQVCICMHALTTVTSFMHELDIA